MKERVARFWGLTKNGRTLSQALFLGLTVWISAQFLMGVRGANVERYCPFGGIETLIPWINKTGTLCSLSTMNLSILFGVIAITVLFKRAFCSHVCPMGAVLEWAGRLSRRFGIKKRRVPRKIDKALTFVKYPLLALILYFTITKSELIFRDFDPYYVLFTAGKGHGIKTFGVGVTAAILLFGLIVPLSFCKYLCPMGACLAPFARFGAVRVVRNEKACTSCGACDKACEWGIEVSKTPVIKSAECSNCQDCVGKCPEPDALSLQIGRAKS
jgi:polyferredoxin